ncbi:MAG: hypothetical protein II429_04400 [Prevotella sp.]|nr:hypothetical protein [Prevotella sp.]
MTNLTNWNDDYWLLLLQLYLLKPKGLKPMYSKPMVELAMELHIHPKVLFSKMCQLTTLQTPRIERIWQQYGQNPTRLRRAVSLLRQMKGYGDAEAFYEGVEIRESFEKDFKPVAPGSPWTPVSLTLVLDLYFRLTPNTMVTETPEVRELARLLKVRATDVVEVMEIFQRIDPYLNRNDVMFSDLLGPCSEVWHRHGSDDLEQLASYAKELKEYYA